MTELLAPAGDFEGIASAIKAGANSIYFGIKGLNMRSASAKNFTIEELPLIAKQCHASNVRCYITLNTLVYNHEWPRLEKILAAVKASGVDAVIASDMGVIKRARELGIEVHISTQASISNSDAAKFYSQFSSRLILAREVSLEQTKQIKEDLKAAGLKTELEIFVHGALCVAESGRCFMSQFHNRTSANRGQCLQECRRKYKIVDIEEPRREFILDNQYVMSPKDLCALPILDKVIASGVDVLKIEGRAKGPEYIYKATKVYREAIDAVENGTFTDEKIADWLDTLNTVYNRGLHDNFLLGTPTNDSWARSYGNQAKEIKTFVGTVMNYLSNKKVAIIKLEDHEIALGDTLAISGPTTGYSEFKAHSMQIENAPVKKARNQLVSIESDLVRRNDRVFKIVKNTISDAKKKILLHQVHEPFRVKKDGKIQNKA